MSIVKKAVSVFLILAMAFSLSTIGLANNIFGDDANYQIDVIDEGHIFILTSLEKNVVVMTNDDTKQVVVAIKYLSPEERIYEWQIPYYDEEFCTNELLFWYNVIEYAEDHIDDAKEVEITVTEHKNSNDISPFAARNSAIADMAAEMEEELGEEYAHDLKYSRNYNGQVFRVYEDMQFNFYEDKVFSWRDAISVASFIVDILKKVATTQLVKAICTACGLVLNAASMLPSSGEIQRYTCIANVYRYVTANGSMYHYNITHKYIVYDGYENLDLSDRTRASVDMGSKTIDYGDGETYFNDYDEQVEDAWLTYKVLGQQP